MAEQGSRRSILVSPGPVHVFRTFHEGLPEIHHRSDEFRDIVRESLRLLRELMGTSSEVHLLTASGTGAMEAAVANLAVPGMRALVVSGGKFGDRWAEICDAYECQVTLMRAPDGRGIDPAEIVRRVERERPEALFVTHVESSTGLLLPLRELCSMLPENGPLLIVDAISSIGAETLEMDSWRIDALVGASQKSLAAPAGMSFLALGPRAVLLAGRRSRGVYYFDLARSREALARGDTSFTPAIETVQIMHRALRGMSRVGFDHVMERHREASRAFLAAAGLLGFRSFSEQPSSAVQVIVPPPGGSAKALLEHLARRGFIAAGGQGDLEGKVVRTGFLGLFGARTLEELVEALGSGLMGAGRRIESAAAVGSLKGYPHQAPLFESENA